MSRENGRVVLKFFNGLKDKIQQNDQYHQSTRIYIFDFFRALACIGVVLHHFLFHPTLHYLHKKIGITEMWTDCFVLFFLFISGFSTMISIEKNNIKQFFIKRVFHLIPFLLVSNCFYFFIFNISINCENIINLITSTFMITDVVNTSNINSITKLIIFVSWYLQVEIKFYIICGLTYFFKKSNTKKRLYIILILNILLYAIVYFYNLPHSFGSFAYCSKLVSACCLGSIYYYFYTKKISFIEFFILSFLHLILVYKATNANQHYAYIVGYFIILVSAILFSDKGNNKIVKYICSISYQVYLFHWFAKTITDNRYKVLFDLNSFKEVLVYFSSCIIYFIPFLILILIINDKIQKPIAEFTQKLSDRLK